LKLLHELTKTMYMN